MHIQHRPRHKTLITQMTNVRPLPGMTPYMYHQTGALRERLMAIVTLVRFFPGMHPFMFDQNRFLRETLLAVRACVRLIPGVRAHVELEFLGTGEGFPANVADGHVARVHVHVQLEAVLVLVAFLADDALVNRGQILHGVFVDGAFMRGQKARIIKFPIARVAFEGLRACVDVLVFHVPRMYVETLIALLADVFCGTVVVCVHVFRHVFYRTRLKIAENTREDLIGRVHAHVQHVVQHLLVANIALLAIKLIFVHLQMLLQTLVYLELLQTDIATEFPV